jgi:hypothetical protein
MSLWGGETPTGMVYGSRRPGRHRRPGVVSQQRWLAVRLSRAGRSYQINVLLEDEWQRRTKAGPCPPKKPLKRVKNPAGTTSTSNFSSPRWFLCWLFLGRKYSLPRRRALTG